MNNLNYPLSVEHIFSQSFGIALKAFRLLLPFYAGLVGLNTLCSNQYIQGNLILSLAIGLIAFIAACYLSAGAILLSGNLWGAESPDVRRDVLGKIDLLLMLEMTWLAIRMTLTSIPLFLCLILPGLIYLINRSLSSYPLILNRCTVSDALRESKALMTSQPWYLIHGPQMRISGLLLVFTLFVIGVSIALLLLSGLLALAAHVLIGEEITGWTPLILQILGGFVQQYITVLGLALMTGFYLDLKHRTTRNDSPELQVSTAP